MDQYDTFPGWVGHGRYGIDLWVTMRSGDEMRLLIDCIDYYSSEGYGVYCWGISDGLADETWVRQRYVFPQRMVRQAVK